MECGVSTFVCSVASFIQKHKKVILTFLCVVVLILAWFYYKQQNYHSNIIPLTQQQAENSHKIEEAAEIARVPVSAWHAKEIASAVKEVSRQVPDRVVTVPSTQAKEVVQKTHKGSKADLTITAPVPSTQENQENKTELKVYNIKAYPNKLVELSFGRRGQEVAYLRRVNAPAVPLLLPKGGVGYIGPYLRVEKEKSRLDYGVKLIIPL